MNKKLLSYGFQWEKINAPRFKRALYPIGNSRKVEPPEVKEMTSIREEALLYEAPRTKNIADLDKVSTQLDIVKRTYGDGEDAFTVNEVTIDGDKYRVPNSVLKQLKDILVLKPEMQSFRVKKSGEGLNTSYTVVSLD